MDGLEGVLRVAHFVEELSKDSGVSGDDLAGTIRLVEDPQSLF